MKKSIIFATVSALCCAAAFFSACGGEQNSSSFSTLTGNFSGGDTEVYQVSSERGEYNLDNIITPAMPEGFSVEYVTDCRLRLARDYTYVYSYTINLRNPGWKDSAASISVEMEGTYEYSRSVLDGSQYHVTLSDATGGSMSITGAYMYSHMSGNGLNKWTIHSAPDFTADLNALFEQGYGVNDYCRGRQVTVDTDGKSLDGDELFYKDVLRLISKYNTYI